MVVPIGENLCDTTARHGQMTRDMIPKSFTPHQVVMLLFPAEVMYALAIDLIASGVFADCSQAQLGSPSPHALLPFVSPSVSMDIPRKSPGT